MKNNIRTGKGSPGFTLLELLITIGILGILAAVAIPAFSAWMPNYRLKRAVQDLYSNFHLTKMKAIKANDSCRVVFTTSGTGSYGIQRPDGTFEMIIDLLGYDPSGNISYGGGNATKNATVSGGSIPTDGVSFNSNKATFNPRGMGSAGYVYLANSKGAAYAIGCWSTGLIILKKWNASSSSWE